MLSTRIYERDTDALFIRIFRERPYLAAMFAERVTGSRPLDLVEVKGQVRHVGCTGSIDIVLRFRDGPTILIENKIDAAYSVTRIGEGQPQRYKTSVAAFRKADVVACSVLVAPARYLLGSLLADSFDARISYEELRDLLNGNDLALLEAAIAQAAIPYEPVPNIHAANFFAAMRALISDHFPDLIMKRDPNADGVRPEDSRTVYFDVPRTLRAHSHVPKPRMSLQCWDNAARSASVKIMLPGRGLLVGRLPVPQSLTDIGGYLRQAGRSLGIVVDTPRLDTQRPLAEQSDDVMEALEAALRLQGWWNSNAEILRHWVISRS